MFLPSISKEDLRNLPVLQFSGSIHVIDTPQTLIEACRLLSTEKVLGFDTETKPSFAKGKSNKVAILQLSTNTDAFIFRLKKTGLLPELIQILSSPYILKVGAAIHDDIKHLKIVSFFKEGGFVDLQSFVKQFGIENFGLSKLAGIVLKFRISKSQQLSNWENEILLPPQLIYASTDAWVALRIYQELNKALEEDQLDLA
jgi:ribonuclease D